MMYPTPKYSEVIAARNDAPGNQLGRYSGCCGHAPTLFIKNVYTPPSPNPQNTRLANDPPRSPATNTSAQAVPSGNESAPCSFTINCRRNGIMKSTPSHPPNSASIKILEYSSGNPKKISAGKVKITPAATDSPADPVVCTILFSKMVARPNARKILMLNTAIGIEADTV